MSFLKRILSKRSDRKLAPPCTNLLPHLHPSPKKNLPVVGKSYPLYVMFHKMDTPGLPRIIFRPATPPAPLPFERSGSNFVLRKSTSCEVVGSRTVVGHLQVPKRIHKQRRASLHPSSRSLREYMEEGEDGEKGLEEDIGKEYRRYLAGLGE